MGTGNTTVINLDDLELIANEAIDIAHTIFTENQPGQLTQKTERDFASELDYTIEQTLREFLRKRAPSVGFLGEEEGAEDVDPEGTYWALDPVDGTANLVHGIPLCGVSLGLISNRQPVLGIIDLPHLSERYTARERQGAHLNGIRLQASACLQLSDAIISLGDFTVGPDAERNNERKHKIIQSLASRAERIRMLGSAALDLAWVASGRLDASVMLANKPWDVAAGVIIAREAGAKVLDIDGTVHTPDARATVSTTPTLASELLSVLDV